MDLTFVSTNVGKYREVKGLLAEFGIRTRWSDRALPEIQADRLETVVRAKLRGVQDLSGYVLVEDSGLFIPALRGFPGVYSAYAYRTMGTGGVLRLLGSQPRTAVFRTVAGLTNGSHKWLFAGQCAGQIGVRPRGRNGFGFDPIFVPRGQPRTFAEMTRDAKNRYSHRARAIRKVGAFLHGVGD